MYVCYQVFLSTIEEQTPKHIIHNYLLSRLQEMETKKYIFLHDENGPQAKKGTSAGTSKDMNKERNFVFDLVTSHCPVLLHIHILGYKSVYLVVDLYDTQILVLFLPGENTWSFNFKTRVSNSPCSLS